MTFNELADKINKIMDQYQIEFANTDPECKDKVRVAIQEFLDSNPEVEDLIEFSLEFKKIKPIDAKPKLEGNN